MCNGSMRQWGSARRPDVLSGQSAHCKIDAQQRILRESALQDRCAAAHPTGVRIARSMRSSASYGSVHCKNVRSSTSYGSDIARMCAAAHATC
jgi:hypothetical protein